MSHTAHLPIWKATIDLAVHLGKACQRFPRSHKYSLGSDLRQCARRLCRLVVRANAARGRVLDELMLTVEDMKTLLTLVFCGSGLAREQSSRPLTATPHPNAGKRRCS
jgi:hypothetical protein